MKDKRTIHSGLLALLGMLHLPLLWSYYQRLWQQEHYQFFPFALGAFAWFLWTRRRDGFELRPLSFALASLDLVLILSGTYFSSPWLVCLGFVIWCYVVASGFEDREFDLTLGYLAILPLLTLRLPLGWDLTVIQWLQRVTTAVASLLLNDFGHLHLREGNVIEFPGKRFLVADACSGVQSLFTLLFLGALISCGYRRKWGHSLFVLICAAGFAGLMNVVRVYTIAAAWDNFGLDLSSGWQHDVVGYVALVVAALLVLSADAFVFFLFSPVPDVAGSGMSALYRNPLVVAWNWCFMTRRRLTAEQMAELEITDPKQVDKMGDRVMPAAGEYLRPASIFSWVSGFLEHWLFSRNPAAIRMATPFFIFGLGGAAFVWWLQTSAQNDVVQRYEEAVVKALDDEDKQRQRIYLETLLQLRPKDQRYRLQHVSSLVAEGEVERALPHIQMLTSRTLIEYSAAHRWLAQQAVSQDPSFPLEPDEIESHLLRAVELNPTDVEARRLLAAVLASRGQLQPAERHLMDVLELHPEVSLELARLKARLGRPQESVDQMAQMGADYYLEQIKKNPRNAAARIQRSEALVMLGQIEAAEQNLLEGASDERTPAVNRALSRFYADLASKRMQDSALNRELAKRLIEQALSRAPGNRRALEVAVSLDSFGISVDSELLLLAVELLQQRYDELNQADRLLLVQSLALAGRTQEALDLLPPLVAERPSLQLLNVRLLFRSGQEQAANRLIDSMVARRDEDASKEEGVVTSLNAAEALTFRGDLDASLEILRELRGDEQSLTPQEVSRLRQLWSRVHVAMFDRRQNETPGTGVTLLEKALETGGDLATTLERLVQVSFSDAPEAAYAEKLLTQVLTNGRVNASVYTLIGSQAILKDRIDDARKYLERAYSMSSNDPMVLNNLALALVRGETSQTNIDRAMRLVDEALRILPDHPDVVSTRAEVHIARKDWENARRDLEVALQDRPNSVRCRQLLGVVCDQQGESELAREHRRRASELLQAAEKTPGS